MADPIKMEVKPLPDGGSMFSVRIEESQVLTNHAVIALIQEIVAETAKRYVQEHYGEIVAQVDTKAIANLVIAKCADRIASAVTITPAK